MSQKFTWRRAELAGAVRPRFSACSAASRPSIGGLEKNRDDRGGAALRWALLACVVALGFALVAAGCGPIPGQLRTDADGIYQRGDATYYADRFHGRTTASGERFNINAFTAAHKTLPFGTIVRVTRVDNGRYVVVRINDRGPYSERRIIDLSKAAARSLDMLREGVVEVIVEVVGKPEEH